MESILRKSGLAIPESASHEQQIARKAPPPFPELKQESVLDRRRPIPKDDVPTTPLLQNTPKFKSSISTLRKPVGTPTGLGVSNAPAVKPASTPTDTSSIHSKMSNKDPKTKGLPPAPSILSAGKDEPIDHVALLRGQMDDLALRRNNIQRAIHNLTKAQADVQNPMLTDWRASRESERRIQALRDELAECYREEHDLGLKLHRAYKRRERAGEMSGTSALWVRRVTG